MSDQPGVHADQAREALRLLAYATRDIEDPTQIYPVLGELANGLASLTQALHQIAESREELAHENNPVTDHTNARRAAAYQVAWELHRAAEMLHQVATAIDRAHEVESRISHEHRLSLVTEPSRPSPEPELTL